MGTKNFDMIREEVYEGMLGDVRSLQLKNNGALENVVFEEGSERYWLNQMTTEAKIVIEGCRKETLQKARTKRLTQTN